MQTEIKITGRFVFNILLLAVAVWFFIKIPSTLFTFGLGLVFYLILEPLVGIFERFLKFRWLAIATVFLIFVLLLAVGFWLIIPRAIGEAAKLLNQWPVYYEQVAHWLDANANRLDSYFTRLDPQLAGQVQIYLNNTLNAMANWLMNSLQGAINFSLKLFSKIVAVILALLISIYLLADEKKIKEILAAGLQLSPKNVDRLHFMVRHVNQTINGYFRGMSFLSFILFICSLTFLTLMGVPYALLLAVWVGLCEFIPYLGPFLGAAPSLLIAYLSSFALGNWTLLFYIILQTAEANILAPRILGRSLNVHPLVIFFAMLAGGEVYGIVGVIIAAPTAAVLIAFLKLYREGLTESDPGVIPA